MPPKRSNKSTHSSRRTKMESSQRSSSIRPKTRTGCITCRSRKVKCDEEKPSCRRCRSTGRQCEGYDLPVSFYKTRGGTPAGETASTEQQNTSTKKDTPEPAPAGLDASDPEQVSAILNLADEQLKIYFDVSIWHQLILPMTIAEPAVRAALLAVSVLHRDLRSGESRPADQSARENHHASGHYLKAIHLLQARIDNSEPTAVVLVTCILAVCFEVLSGNKDGAEQHLQAGLNIVSSPQLSPFLSPEDQARANEEHQQQRHYIGPLLTDLIIKSSASRDLWPLFSSMECMALLRFCCNIS